jgi:hypothetical protein
MVTTAGAICLVMGVVLLLVETGRALTGNGLGVIEQGLLWAGLAEVVIGVILLLFGAARSDAAAADAAADEDADVVDDVSVPE